MKLSVPFREEIPVSAAVPVQEDQVPRRVLENVPEGALLDVVVRCDSSTSTSYVLFGTSNDATQKIVTSDGPVRVRFITTKTTQIVGDGVTTPIFRVLGYALGGTQVK